MTYSALRKFVEMISNVQVLPTFPANRDKETGSKYYSYRGTYSSWLTSFSGVWMVLRR